MAKHKAVKAATSRLSKAKLRSMTEEATVDAYGEDEQRVGFFTMLEDNLSLPFETTVLGIRVTAKAIDMTSADEIVVLCVRGKESQRIPILDLPLPSPRPQGWEWIEAYRRWLRP